MPYVQMNTNCPLSEQQKTALLNGAAEMITVIPTKTPERTMVEVNDGKNMIFGCNDQPCMKVRVELFHDAPYEAKREYLQKLFALIRETAGIEESRIYMTFLIYDEWGSGGSLRQ